MEKSSLRLTSNIVLKSKYERDLYGCLPFDLMPDYYKDTRLNNALTEYQKTQKVKKLFAAEYVIQSDSED